MSAALQLPELRAGSASRAGVEAVEERPQGAAAQSAGSAERPVVSLAFYRRYTDRLLRRYLYASMQVGRAPAILGDPVGRGWASSRTMRTFEDALVFVLDVESCLSRLEPIEQQLISRIVLQAYTQEEAAAMMGMVVRTVNTRLARGIDRLTELLLEAEILIVPD